MNASLPPQIRQRTVSKARTLLEALPFNYAVLSTPVLHPDHAEEVMPAFLAAIARDPNQFLAVVDDGGTVAGCLQLSFIPGLSLKGMWRGQIESVRIAASRRGQGLGHVMIEWAIAECRRRGCGLVQLTMNKSRQDSHRFYESLGFEATHEGFKLML